MKLISLRPDNWRELRCYIEDKNKTTDIISDLISTDYNDMAIIKGENKDRIRVIYYFPITGRD